MFLFYTRTRRKFPDIFLGHRMKQLYAIYQILNKLASKLNGLFAKNSRVIFSNIFSRDLIGLKK